MRSTLAAIALVAVSGAGLATPAGADEGIATGPEVGTQIPSFAAQDQNGDSRRLADLTGPEGLLLLFHRYGFAYAGYYLIDADGMVKAKFFNEPNNDRYTSANIMIRELGGDPDNRGGKVKTKHLTLAWSSSNDTLRPGQRAALVLKVKLKPGMHLYAPGDHRYIAATWAMEEATGAELLAAEYPQAEEMHLEAIQETVPVYNGTMKIVRDIHLLGGRELPEELQDQEHIEIRGEFEYQACDDKVCYLPVKIPVDWTFNLQPHDLVRVPEDMRRGAEGG